MESAMMKLCRMMKEKNSRIVAGLDPVWKNLPPIDYYYWCDNRPKEYDSKFFSEYCERYIDAIADKVAAIKMNIAFFEPLGEIPLYYGLAEYAHRQGLFVIADAKRADIGSTSAAYAEAFLGEDSSFDAVTINPYFGTDGVKPFLDLAKENEKGVFVLVKTSNPSSSEIQDLMLSDGRHVYEAVADKVKEWGEYASVGTGYNPVGAVVGATHPQISKELRKRMPNTFFLVPGFGAQGATAKDVANCFDENGGGAIVNSSRGIMNAYKSDKWKEKFSPECWEKASDAEAEAVSNEINEAIKKRRILR